MSDTTKISSYMRGVMEELGYDLTDPHMADSPKRIAKYLTEWHTQNAPLPVLTTFPNEDSIDEMVAVGGIPFFAMCAHHGLPFHGVAAIGYVPSNSILGLSKFARIVDHFANRFTVQERLTKEIADALEASLKPRALGVVIRAEHMCMSLRGVKKIGAHTVTSDLRGLLRDDAAARSELLSLVG